MNNYRRDLLFSDLDQVIVHLKQSRSNIAAQKKRLVAIRQRGDDTARSEERLATFSECLRLHQSHYDRLLEEINRFH